MIKITMTFEIQVKQEGDWYIAGNADLDVYSQGRSEREAVDNVGEALELFFESCAERGSLMQVLSEAGLSPTIEPIEEEVPSRRWLDVALPAFGRTDAEALASPA